MGIVDEEGDLALIVHLATFVSEHSTRHDIDILGVLIVSVIGQSPVSLRVVFSVEGNFHAANFHVDNWNILRCDTCVMSWRRVYCP